MKQVVQNLKSGALELVDVPCPRLAARSLLIQTQYTLVSAGSERTVVEFGRANLLAKARSQPERVRQVLDRIRSDGLLPTLELVFAKLDEPIPLGYCNAGRVIAVGEGVDSFAIGDRVASNGQHAELVSRPVNLCAKIPPGVDAQHATFATLGAIGLQGIRLLAPTLGETVVVYGLGLIGLVAVQLLVESGVRVLGIDISAQRLALAETFGATVCDASGGADPVAAGLAFAAGHGVDGVLITASSSGDSIIGQSARMSRKRGRVVLVGVVNMDLNRADFYEKELSLQVSCSYGPGRYDPVYEDRGIDYPLPYVRWTEQRNMEAILQMIASGRLDVESLITARVPHAEAARGYDLLAADRAQLGIVLEYPDAEPPLERTVTAVATRATVSRGSGRAGIGVIGAGEYTKLRLLPALKRAQAPLISIASATGVSAAYAARKYGFRHSTTDYHTMLDDPDVDAVIITTRHDLHVPMAVDALSAGKHVLLEKPAAIDRAGLDRLRAAREAAPELQFVVGFNRRFSPHAARIKQLLTGRTQPVCMNMMINAGALPADHWLHDRAVGGGRIIGEACHWIDLLRWLVGAPIVEVRAAEIGQSPALDMRNDKMSVSLLFAEGSLGNVHYFANGHRAYSKERLEVFSDGRVLELDNFRTLHGYGWASFRRMRLMRQDKGTFAEINSFVDRVVSGGEPLMPADEIWNVTLASFAAEEAARSGRGVELTK